MSSTDDWLQNGLPVYSGGKDRSTARRLIDRLGGPHGIKTAYQNNPDGTIASRTKHWARLTDTNEGMFRVARYAKKNTERVYVMSRRPQQVYVM